MNRLTRDGTAEPVSRDHILRRERKIYFPIQLTTQTNKQYTGQRVGQPLESGVFSVLRTQIPTLRQRPPSRRSMIHHDLNPYRKLDPRTWHQLSSCARRNSAICVANDIPCCYVCIHLESILRHITMHGGELLISVVWNRPVRSDHLCRLC